MMISSCLTQWRSLIIGGIIAKITKNNTIPSNKSICRLKYILNYECVIATLICHVKDEEKYK